jgi:hypothetical protein
VSLSIAAHSQSLFFFFEQKALIGAHSLYIIGFPTHREILEHQRQSSERGEQVFDAKKK